MEKENIFMERLSLQHKKNRLIAFYKSKKFTDCSFIIDGVEVKAHKLILACSSPVFEKMFFGDMAASKILICDINLLEFNQMLEFVYSEEVAISSVPHAWSLFYIGNKYLLDDLTYLCLNYVKRNLTMTNLVLNYEFAEMYNLPDLKYKCFTDINNYLKGVFLTDYHMKASTLHSILEHDHYNMDCFELVVKILEWGAIECDFKELSVLTENIVDILKDLDMLKYVKKQWLFNLKCSTCGDALIMCLCSGELIHDTLLHLDGILHDDEPSKELCDVKKHALHTCRFRKVYKIAGRVDLRDSQDYVTYISVNRKTIMFGFLINTEVKPTNVSDEGYQGTVTIRVSQQNSDTEIGKPTTFSGDFRYGSDCYVSLNDLVVLHPNINYDVKISYKNYIPGESVSSVVCYYMSKELKSRPVDCFDTVISFFEMYGSVIKGVCFYPA